MSEIGFQVIPSRKLSDAEVQELRDHYLVYAKADLVLTRLGRTGGMIVARLSAFILLCIGVQIVWNGVRALVATL